MSNKTKKSTVNIVNIQDNVLTGEITKAQDSVKMPEVTNIQDVGIIGLNVGGGEWSSPGWYNIDKCDGATHVHDFRKKKTFPFKSNTFQFVFSSHVLEHFNNDEAQNIINEMYRVLKPGGTLRISVTYVYAAYNALLANDIGFFDNGEILIKGKNIETKFINFFCSYGRDEGGGGPEIDPVEFRKRMNRKSVTDVIDEAINTVLDRSKHVEHQNWFDAMKLFNMLKTAGFKKTYKSEFNKSKHNEFKFDNRPKTSVFVEAVK